MEGFFERGVNREIPAVPLFIDDRTDLPSPSVLGEGTALVTNLRRKTKPDRQVPFFRRANARTNMIPDPLPTVVRLNTGKDIEPCFKPRGEAMRNLAPKNK